MSNINYTDIMEKLAASLIKQNNHVLETIDFEGVDNDLYESVDLIVDFYSKPCKWEHMEVCVNHDSEWCADFVNNVKCGGCHEYEVD